METVPKSSKNSIKSSFTAFIKVSLYLKDILQATSFMLILNWQDITHFQYISWFQWIWIWVIKTCSLKVKLDNGFTKCNNKILTGSFCFCFVCSRSDVVCRAVLLDDTLTALASWMYKYCEVGSHKPQNQPKVFTRLKKTIAKCQNQTPVSKEAQAVQTNKVTSL